MWKRVLLLIAGTALSVVGAGITYLTMKQPESLPPEPIQVPLTKEAVARGEYIFTVLADCDGCHSQRDVSRFSLPVIPAGRGKGWEFPHELGLPGRVVAPNITPDVETGIGAWTDGEKIRAIREGIGRDGRALFPMMPYQAYAKMSDSDVYALVAYLNTLPGLQNRLPRTDLDFPLPWLIKDAPKPSRKVSEPDFHNKIEKGKYLVMMAGCAGCHTPQERGAPIEGKVFAGGEVFRLNGMKAVSANITPDPDTGIGKMEEEEFIERFHQYKKYLTDGAPATKPENFTIMPWLSFAKMPREELGAIYAYLRTVTPVANSVETHPQ